MITLKKRYLRTGDILELSDGNKGVVFKDVCSWNDEPRDIVVYHREGGFLNGFDYIDELIDEDLEPTELISDKILKDNIVVKAYRVNSVCDFLYALRPRGLNPCIQTIFDRDNPVDIGQGLHCADCAYWTGFCLKDFSYKKPLDECCSNYDPKGDC